MTRIAATQGKYAAGNACRRSAGASGENGNQTPQAMINSVSSTTGATAVLWTKGIFSVRIVWTIKVCVSSPSTNQPDWNRDCVAVVLAPKPYHKITNVAMSKSELMGPIHSVKVAMLRASH